MTANAKTWCACLLAAVAVCGVVRAADEAKCVVGEGDGAKVYELSALADAKAYVDAYAVNVQADVEFKAHEAAALRTIRRDEPLFGSWWAMFPPLLAILLAIALLLATLFVLRRIVRRRRTAALRA